MMYCLMCGLPFALIIEMPLPFSRDPSIFWNHHNVIIAYLRLWVLSNKTIGLSTQHNRHIGIDHVLSAHVFHISVADAKFIFASL